MSIQTDISTKLKVAVHGCVHGSLKRIYDRIEELAPNERPDLLLILGDVQTIRTSKDLSSISIPAKYMNPVNQHRYNNHQNRHFNQENYNNKSRYNNKGNIISRYNGGASTIIDHISDFPQYFNGVYEVTVPTLIIGGNHENMRQFMELPYGGYLLPNMVYLGWSQTIWFKGIKIGGISGITKLYDYYNKRPEYNEQAQEGGHKHSSFNENSWWNRNKKSLYHVRFENIIPLYNSVVKDGNSPSIMLSHDWPRCVVRQGDLQGLLKKKPFFKNEVEQNILGSPLYDIILRKYKPTWWFSAHLHVKYTAEYKHGYDTAISCSSKDEIKLFDDEDKPKNECQTTHFLALDKYLPRRKGESFDMVEIEVEDVQHPSLNDNNFYFDPEFVGNLLKVYTNKDIIEDFKKKIKEQYFNENTHDFEQDLRTICDVINKKSVNINANNDDVDWEDYKFPECTETWYKDGIQQTNYFIDRYFKKEE
ncbi:RNA lariat debranching enzyme SCDLUD_004772 [Saccharomycodes ludwigii]|uniref:RNA lariat debranching enzyme n=1 Tax=Saccharomycodes ludwigii TaxID=36035 RepID=UPI001E8B6730|nr:hypothetical protein SCDLUD_004772 [Saccharomycodes ludwigii]KAH3899333.1 hypothetical protein SCDLUD_004772 [Saccharomycodes ludwigii]